VATRRKQWKLGGRKLLRGSAKRRHRQGILTPSQSPNFLVGQNTPQKKANRSTVPLTCDCDSLNLLLGRLTFFLRRHRPLFIPLRLIPHCHHALACWSSLRTAFVQFVPPLFLNPVQCSRQHHAKKSYSTSYSKARF
jgi:hypothetical protein